MGGRNIQSVENSSPCILTCNGNYAFCGRCPRTMAKNNRDLRQNTNNSKKISNFFIFTLQIKVSLLLRYLGWLLQCFVAPCVCIVVLHLFSCLCFVLVESCVDYHSVLLPLFCCPWLCYQLIVHPSVLPPLDSSPTLNISRLGSLTHNYDHWLEHKEMQDSRILIAIHFLSLRTFRGFEVLRFPNLLRKKIS